MRDVRTRTGMSLSNNDTISDFCDGSFFKTHPLFSVSLNALQLIAYYDELEVCNPLVSHSGIHKLGKMNHKL